MAQRLDNTFFLQDGISLAQQLLGKLLVRKINNETIICRIIETEAYMGALDKASHAFGNKRTKRTETMYLSGGHSYVYLIYGMYHCLNVVANQFDIPEAVLIRALEPLEGIDTLRKNRVIKQTNPKYLTNGPGKLCQALQITKALDACDLITGETLYIASDNYTNFNISESTRINIDYAGEDKHKLWRYFVTNSEFVSVKDK